jgi:long-subunit fatty acid transport protein
VKTAPALLLFVGALPAARTAAQTPSPPPPSTPERVFQDELDLQANANFVQGSGARAFGMGGAFLARADDATAASWNPAGLSYLRTPELSFVYVDTNFEGRQRSQGFDVIDRGSGQSIRFDYERERSDDRSGGFPDFMAFTWPWQTGEMSGAVQASFQRVIGFTSRRTITDAFTGTTTNAETGVTSPRATTTIQPVSSTGGFDIFALGAGGRVSRKVRLGMTLNFWFHGYEQTVRKPDQTVPSRQQSEFDVSGSNAHIGAIVSPWESLNLGIVVKTGFTATAKLKRVRYDSFPEHDTVPARTIFNVYSREDLRLKLPEALGLGASWRPRSNLTLSMDYTLTNWSAGSIRQFFALPRASPVNSDGTPRPVDDPRPSPLDTGDFCGDDPDERFKDQCPSELPYPTLDVQAEQADTEQIRAGVEYVILKNRFKWPLRAGYFRDGQFFRSFDGDAPKFNGFTLGTGLLLDNVLLDVAYVYESGSYTDANLELEDVDGQVVHFQAPAENHVKSHKIYASVIYRLPRRR